MALNTGSRNEAKNKYVEIALDLIVPNPNQPRRTFDDAALAELAESIKQVGLIQPLIVRRTRTGYQLVAGERRLRAMKLIGRKTAPCVVEAVLPEEDSAMLALVENLQREDLHYLEEAECYRSIIAAFGLTQEQLAERIGKSQSAVANKLRLLKLPDEIKGEMVEKGLSERHARAVLRVTDEKTQRELIDRIATESLSAKETDALVDRTLNSMYDERKAGAKPRPVIIRLVKDFRLFINTVNTAVNQLRDSGVDVGIEQTDYDDGVDILIKVRKKN